MANPKTDALIVAMAKKAVSKRTKGSDDCEAVAEDVLAAMKSGSAKDLAKALRAFRDVASADGGEDN